MSQDERIHEIRRDINQMKNGVELISDERADQLRKGWWPGHDDGHQNGELAQVAAIVAAHGTDLQIDGQGEDWGIIGKHPNDRIHQLAIAGALIAAEIDRLRRRQEKEVAP